MKLILQGDDRRYNKYLNEKETNDEINYDNGSGDAIRGNQNYEFQAFNACMSGNITFIEEYLACDYPI